VPRASLTDRFTGIVPTTGLRAGTGVRSGNPGPLGKAGRRTPPDHPAWQMEAYYLAMAVNNYILTLSPTGSSWAEG